MPDKVRSKVSGPGFGLLPPLPHPVGTVHTMVYMNAPNAPLGSGAPNAKPFVMLSMFAAVIDGFPARLNSSAEPAPVDTKSTPFVNVTRTSTMSVPLESSSFTVPYGPAPQPPEQPF